jgi:nucleoside-diphosphate-sugar epimerase
LSGLDERGGDSIGCIAAELAIPFLEQPGRHGQFGGAIGPGNGRAICFSQDRVDQACCRRSAQTLHQFDAFADGGVRRDAIEVAQLVDAHTECDADFGLGRSRNTASDQVIELGLIAEASEDYFGGERGVARIEMRGALQQKVRSVAAVVDFLENLEGDLARGGDQVLF